MVVSNRRLSALKFDIMQLLRNEWNKRWTADPLQAKETKLWFPEIDSKKSFQLMYQRNRFDFSILVQAITGANHLMYYEGKIDKTENTSRRCTICKASVMTGQMMTTKHIFTECDRLAWLRLQAFGTHEPIISELSIQAVNRFLTEANEIIPWLPEGYRP